MANTTNLSLYEPNRNDAKEVDVSLTENFRKLDSVIGDPSTLTTAEKAVLVKAMNEILADFTTHQADELSNGVHGIATTSDATYYVDAVNGADTNDGLTSTSAFATINKAIGLIPQIVNHTVTIEIADGSYAEGIEINSKTGKGIITINAGTSVTLTGVTGSGDSTLEFRGNGITIRVYSNPLILNPSKDFGSTNYYGCVCSNSRFVALSFILDGANVTTTGREYGVTVNRGGNARIQNCTIDNCNFAAIAGYETSRIYSLDNVGTGNARGLLSDATTIMKSLNQPGGTTLEQTTNGGVIR